MRQQCFKNEKNYLMKLLTTRSCYLNLLIVSGKRHCCLIFFSLYWRGGRHLQYHYLSPKQSRLKTCTTGKRKNMLFFLLSCLFQFVEVRCSKRRPPGPQAGEWCCSPGEQHMVGLSKLSVHDSIEHRVDTAVEPGEV